MEGNLGLVEVESLGLPAKCWFSKGCENIRDTLVMLTRQGTYAVVIIRAAC